jgi:hypothetical protein
MTQITVFRDFHMGGKIAINNGLLGELNRGRKEEMKK